MKKTILTVGIFLMHLVVGAQDLKAHFINVGQADATLLEFSKGVIMIDVGAETFGGFQGSKESLMRYLKRFFDKRKDLNNTIDIMIITHNHYDHTELINEVGKEYRIKKIIASGVEKNTSVNEVRESTLSEAKNQGINIDYMNYKMLDRETPKGIKIDIDFMVNNGEVKPELILYSGEAFVKTGERINGVKFFKSPFNKTKNNHSIVTKVIYGESSFLFTGDLQINGINYLQAKYKDNLRFFDVDVYQVGHHGAKNATTISFLDVMTPEIAVISAGDPIRKSGGSAYGHGHPNLELISWLNENQGDIYNLNKLRKPFKGHAYKKKKTKELIVDINKEIYCTCWQGDIVLVAKSNGVIKRKK